MAGKAVTFRAIRAERDIEVPRRVGLRVLAIFILLEILLLTALSLAFSSGALAANALKGELTISTSGGFARLVFKFPEEVPASVRLNNGIVVISFQKPVDVPVDRIATSAQTYVNAARRDPDGKAIRLALGQKVTVNSMAAGERFFVDLLPENWAGVPPGLPQEVVEELARRAREAEKKIQLQQLQAERRNLSPIRVRVGSQPTFTRYIFDLPALIAVSSNRDRDKLTLTFEAPVKFDLADALIALPPAVSAIESAADTDANKVTFSLVGKVDVRTFREDNAFVVDIDAADKKDKPDPTTRLFTPANVPVIAREPSAQKTPVQSPPEVKTAPASNPAVPAAPMQHRVERPAAPPVPAPAAPKKEAATKPPSIAAKTDEPKASPLAPKVPAPAHHPTDKPAPIAQAPKPADKPPVVAHDVRPPVAQQPAVAVKDVPAITTEARPAPARDPHAPIVIAVRRQGEDLRLVFPFSAPTPAAVFRRADTLWLVFDSEAPIDIGALIAQGQQVIRTADLSRSGTGQVLRIKLTRPRLASVASEGSMWIVTVGDAVAQPTSPLVITRALVGPGRSNAVIAIESPSQVHRVRDPEVGDTLLIVTAPAPARGLLKSQSFVEFDALACVHGVAILPLADDVNAELTPDKVIVTRPRGLTLSAFDHNVQRVGGLRPVLFDTQLWGYDREADFRARQEQLLSEAANAVESRRAQARYELARFFLAREMYPEAKAVLDNALRHNSDDAALIVMRAIAEIMMSRPEDGLKDLSNPAVGNQHDAPLWRSLAFAGQGRWGEALAGFKNSAATVATLPIELQRLVIKQQVRAAIEVRDFANAAHELNELGALGVKVEVDPTLAVLSGQLAEGFNRTEEALGDFRLAAAARQRPVAAQAKLRELVLRFKLGDLKRTDAISELETLTATWRGDETETEGLQLLARLYTEEKKYRDAFQVMRMALTAHPNSEMTRRIHDEAAATFDALFLEGKGDSLQPIDALGLFYDYRELTPIGRRGDEMIRRLADRLVAVDLLKQAAELLQHQVDHRLQGAARAQVAARLAVVYLMNRKPDQALSVLRATQSSQLPNNLRNQRLLIEARALSDTGRPDLALEVVANIEGVEAQRLRSDILWRARRWDKAAEEIEKVLGDRWSEWQPLNKSERTDVLRAAIGYALGDDTIGLARLRERYGSKLADTPDRHSFDVVTAPLNANGDEFKDIVKSIAAVDTLEQFVGDLRKRFPDTEPADKPVEKPNPVSPSRPAAQTVPRTQT